jgi:hypothetical protein
MTSEDGSIDQFEALFFPLESQALQKSCNLWPYWVSGSRAQSKIEHVVPAWAGITHMRAAADRHSHFDHAVRPNLAFALRLMRRLTFTYCG